MPEFLERRDRWGNSVAMWVLFAMVVLVPPSLWALRGLRLENEVHQWIPHNDPEWKGYAFAERHFSTEDAILCSWDDSRLDDPRIDRLARKIRGKPDPGGKLRGGSPYWARVRTPHDLIGQMTAEKIEIGDAIQRVTGILVGRGPVRVRLTEEGQARKDRLVEAIEKYALERLQLSVEVRSAAVPVTVEETDEDRSVAEAEPAPAERSGSATADADSAASDDEIDEPTGPPETSVADIAAQLPPIEPHDLVVTWPTLVWQREKVDEFCQLLAELEVVRGTISPRIEGQPGKSLVDASFQVPGNPVGLALYLSDAGQAERSKAVAWLKQAAAESGIPAASIHLTGSPIAGNALNEEVLKAVWNPQAPLEEPHQKSLFLFSSIVGGIFALWMLRSWRLALVVLGISYYTTLISTALVPAAGAPINMVLVVMPTLLMVTTLSVAVHIANYWRHAAAADARTAVTQSIRTAYEPVAWAGFTSIIGQLSLCTSSLTPIRDFGIYSSIGTAISLVTTLVCLPALMMLFPSPVPKGEELDNSFWHGLAAWIARHQVLVNTVCLGSALICSLGLYYFRTETKVIRYFGERTQTQKDYRFIEQNLGGVVPVDVIVRFDREAQQELKFLQRCDLVRTIEQRLRELPEISGVLSLSDFLPEIEQPGENAGTRTRQRYATRSRVIESRVKGGKHAGSESLLAVCTDATELNAEGDELWRITAQVAILSDLRYGDLETAIHGVCQSVLREASGTSAEKIPVEGDERQYRPYASHLVTGLVPLFLATQDRLLQSFIISFGGAFLSIALVVMFVLRHPVAGFLAMIPNVLPIVAVFGVVSWMGMQIDMGSTVTASIALGITIDGTLHLVTWFRQGILQGKTRAEAAAAALGHCGPAMWQTTLIVSLGLIVLSPCDLVLISRFGWLMAVLLGAASISDLILTPALLAGPLGYLIEKCTKVTPPAASGSADARPPSVVEPAAESPANVQHSPPPPPHLEKRRMRIRRPD